MRKLIYTVLVASIAIPSNAQNIKDEKVAYTYIKLPAQPLEQSAKNFQSSITAIYEVDNAKKKAEYEEEKSKSEEDFRKAETEVFFRKKWISSNSF